MNQSSVPEAEFITVTNKLVNKLSTTYKFGIYDKDDIAQEIRLLAWEAMSRYDGKHALYQFLLVHVTNRLNTLKRDKWYRATCPCELCDKCDEGKTKHKDGKYCKQFHEWKKRNARKANLASPPSIPDNFDKPMEFKDYDNLENQEVQDVIDGALSVELRGIYLKLKSGIKVPEVSKQKLLTFLKELFNEA